MGTYVYGGFLGTETARNQRDWVANRTVIDGQGVRRCVTASTGSSIDGFAIQNSKDGKYYGGMVSGNAVNCIFSGNSYAGMCFGTAVNCVFSGTADVAATGMRNGTAVNSTFTGHGMRAILSSTAVNCVIWGNSSNDTSDSSVSYSCLPVVTTGPGNIVGDPLFVDAGAGDFRLQAGSACINTGTADRAPATDILGVPRPQGAGVDMGAYEVVVPVTVPDLASLARAAAKDMLTAARLYVGVETEEYHSTVAADHVVRQTPAAGAQSPQWTPVDLVISKGPKPVPVPNVVGQSQAGAMSAITNAGFVVWKITWEYSATLPVGAVIAQTPVGGVEVLPGTAVDLVVSKGMQPLVMPDVVGQPQVRAEAAITAAGLAVGLVTQACSGTVAAGGVISQSPAAGSEVLPGTVVSIVASLGPIPVPEGEGEPVETDTARQQLAEASDTADANGDGTLSFEEASAAITGLSRTLFDALDANGDGQLSPDELGMDTGTGCAGCQGGKRGWMPFGHGKFPGDILLLGLALTGVTTLAGVRRP